MKTVELTCDMRPWRHGDNVPLPDDMADRLVAAGEAKNPRPWPSREPGLSDIPMLTTPLRSDGSGYRVSRPKISTKEAAHGRD